MAPRDVTSTRPSSAGPDPRFNRSLFGVVRRVCLSLPETTETVSWNHPNFRAGKATFCAFEIIGERPSIAFKIPATARALRDTPDSFATPYGRGAWISVWVDRDPDRPAIEALVERSYRAVATKRMLRFLDAR